LIGSGPKQEMVIVGGELKGCSVATGLKGGGMKLISSLIIYENKEGEKDISICARGGSGNLNFSS